MLHSSNATVYTHEPVVPAGIQVAPSGLGNDTTVVTPSTKVELPKSIKLYSAARHVSSIVTVNPALVQLGTINESGKSTFECAVVVHRDVAKYYIKIKICDRVP